MEPRNTPQRIFCLICSLGVPVSSHDLYWENKMYKRKRSITVSVSKFILTPYWKETCWSQMLWCHSWFRVEFSTFNTDEEFDRNFPLAHTCNNEKGTRWTEWIWLKSTVISIAYTLPRQRLYYLWTWEFVVSAWI